MWKKQSTERKSNRKEWHDYSSCGYYFVTMCTKNRIPYFGEIVEGKMALNEYGEVVRHYWKQIPFHYKNVSLDAFIVMPDHIHGIILILDEVCGDRNIVTDKGVESSPEPAENFGIVGTEQCSVPTMPKFSAGSETSPISYGLLSKIIKSYKEIVTKIIRIQYCDDKFQWQRSFYDRIIRDKSELSWIRWYIENNPARYAKTEK